MVESLEGWMVAANFCLCMLDFGATVVAPAASQGFRSLHGWPALGMPVPIVGQHEIWGGIEEKKG
jgi:hypothetical protein